MKILLSVLTVVAISWVPAVSFAQTFCADRDTVIKTLETKYGETFSGGGLRNASSIMEVWSSHEDGSWTILLTRADGTTCIMASGTDWRDGPLIAAKKGVEG